MIDGLTILFAVGAVITLILIGLFSYMGWFSDKEKKSSH